MEPGARVALHLLNPTIALRSSMNHGLLVEVGSRRHPGERQRRTTNKDIGAFFKANLVFILGFAAVVS